MVRHTGSENRNVEVRPNANAFLQRGWRAWLLYSCAAFLAINSAEREGRIAALQAAGVVFSSLLGGLTWQSCSLRSARLENSAL